MCICANQGRKVAPEDQFLSDFLSLLGLALVKQGHHVIEVVLEGLREVLVRIVIDARVHWDVIVIARLWIASVIVTSMLGTRGGSARRRRFSRARDITRRS
jgi:hypothetical protein